MGCFLYFCRVFLILGVVFVHGKSKVLRIKTVLYLSVRKYLTQLNGGYVQKINLDIFISWYFTFSV